MKIFIRKIFIVFLSIFICLNLFGLLLDYQLRRSNVFKVNILFNKKLPENIILGSSRSLTGINTSLLAKLTNIHWYNLSMDDTKTETHLLFLNLLFSLNKTPKTVLLQYDRQNSDVDSTTFFDNDFQLLPFINSNKTISNYFEHKSNYLSFKYLPIYKYIYFNTELLFPCLLTFLNHNYHHRFIENTGDYSYPFDYVKHDSTQKFKNSKIIIKNPLIDNFSLICSKNDAKLFNYTAPVYHVKNTRDSAKYNYFDFSGIYLNASQFSDDFHIAHNTKNDFTIKLSKIFQ